MWFLRRLADSNRCKRFCRPLPSHSAKTPIRDANLIKNIRPSTHCKNIVILITQQRNLLTMKISSGFPPNLPQLFLRLHQEGGLF